MPIIEFSCNTNGHITEKLFLTFAESDRAESIKCPECGGKAHRIVSMPGAPILLGDGFYKPAASGKTHTKSADATKATKEYLRHMGGGKGVITQARGK